MHIAGSPAEDNSPDAPSFSSRQLLVMRAEAEETATQAYQIADGLPDWQQKGRRAEFQEDTEVFFQQVDRSGPYNAATDPEGNAGHWVVELERVTTRWRPRQYLGDIGMRTTLLPPETSVTLRVEVYDTVADPLSMLERRPSRRADLHEATVQSQMPFDVAIDPATPYGMLAVYRRQHKHALGWLQAVIAGRQT